MTDRRSGIGASDAPVIAGLSPWRTPVDLWLEKLGRGAPQEVSLPMRAGTALEGLVLDAFCEETGMTVLDRQTRFIDPAWPVRWATADGITTEGAMVEAKTAQDDEGWGEPGTDQIPAHYVVQVQHALACAELLVAYVPVLIGVRELRVYQVHRDDRIVAQLTEMERYFWEHVQSGEAPPMKTPRELRLVYPQDAGTTVVADAQTIEQWLALSEEVAERKALEKTIDLRKGLIQAQMLDAANLVDADGVLLATWKTTKPVGRFDEAALKAEHPDIWKQYRRAGLPQRRFLLKGATNGDQES
jgi:putative phage-type endonuclease